MRPQSSLWVNTVEMAAFLGIHPKTLYRLKAIPNSPFKESVHFRRRGLTSRAPLQWSPELTEKAFTGFRRLDPAGVETFANA
jgi:hypothetical protein